MARRLKTIARAINDEFPHLIATVEAADYWWERRTPGRRYVNARGRRKGNRLTVRRRVGHDVIFQHNAAEPYRTNAEVERWLERTRERLADPDVGSEGRVW